MKKHLLTSSCDVGGITRLRNNAFTLIELLAIIVILAIIAVITVPIILNIIENSRKGAATDSAYGYKESVNKTYVAELQNHNKLKLDGTYTVNSDGSLTPTEDNTFGFGDSEYGNSLNVQVSGTIPSSGELTYSNNALTEGWLVIGDYRVTFSQAGTVTTTKNSEGQNESNSNVMYEYTYYNMFDESKDEGEIKVQAITPDEKWSMYLRKNLNTNSSIIDICAVYENGTICINNNMFDWDSNSWLNTEKTNQLITNFTSLGATCDTSDTDRIECSGENNIVSWSGDYWTSMLGDEGDRVYCDLYANGDIVCNSLGGIYCSTDFETCYSN